MVSGKRKFQENAAQSNRTGPGKDAIDRLTEVALHLELRIRWSKRVKLSKVRLDMLEMQTAEDLLNIVMGVINGYKTRR